VYVVGVKVLDPPDVAFADSVRVEAPVLTAVTHVPLATPVAVTYVPTPTLAKLETAVTASLDDVVVPVNVVPEPRVTTTYTEFPSVPAVFAVTRTVGSGPES
jgi:hypothetical protein